MKILAIETSCDETGIAVVEGQKTSEGFTFVVLKHALLSQAQLHAEYGGVYPNLAKREHQKNLPVLFEQFKDEKVDAVAVTHGPGLEPALWTGIEFAKQLAAEWGVPLLPTNHMEGHLISSLVKDGKIENVKFPVLGLLISGGHTEFVLMKEWFHYEIIGETLDDAVGEAFDKVARMLALPYPGGPHISRLAAIARSKSTIPSLQDGKGMVGNSTFAASSGNKVSDHPLDDLQGGNFISGALKLPRPMLNTNNCDVSFSGLKTAALYMLRDMGGIQTLSADQIADFAREFEDAVGDIFTAKTLRALEQTGAKTFLIGGGVAANTYLRAKLGAIVAKEFPEVEFKLPEHAITGDNAIMIAEAALTRRLSDMDDSKFEEIRAQGQLSISRAK